MSISMDPGVGSKWWVKGHKHLAYHGIRYWSSKMSRPHVDDHCYLANLSQKPYRLISITFLVPSRRLVRLKTYCACHELSVAEYPLVSLLHQPTQSKTRPADWLRHILPQFYYFNCSFIFVYNWILFKSPFEANQHDYGVTLV